MSSAGSRPVHLCCPLWCSCVSLSKSDLKAVVVERLVLPLSDSKGEKQCFYCHRPGHIAADCFTLKCRRQQFFSNRKGWGLTTWCPPMVNWPLRGGQMSASNHLSPLVLFPSQAKQRTRGFSVLHPLCHCPATGSGISLLRTG